MKLHILGVSGPFPESNGATSGYLLETGDALLQFDLGSGVMARLTALMPPESLSALFLSHWHFDHTADLTVLLYRLAAMGKILKIYAPVDESSAMLWFYFSIVVVAIVIILTLYKRFCMRRWE